MLADAQLQQINEFVGRFSKEELIWMNGYLTGLLQNSSTIVDNGNSATPLTAVKKLSIVFGTETGNAKKLANQLAAAAKKNGIAAKLTAMDQYRLTDLSKEEYFFVIVSTHGEGEPPAAAEKFYQYIHEQQLNLGHLKYSVLALGDSSYPLFCKTGEDVDNRLAALGATRLVTIKKCDVDYEAPAAEWFENIFTTINNNTSDNHPSNGKAPAAPVLVKKAGKKNYEGKIISHINLNDEGSSKETWHIEIATDEQPEYEPGDSAGIIPHNKKEVVDAILQLTGIDETKEITTNKATANVRTLLTRNLNIFYLLRTTVQKYGAIIQTAIPDTRMDLLDLLRIYPVKDALQFEEVMQLLNPIAPRLYTIASSPAVHSNEIHLTVAKHAFSIQNEQRLGVCSEFLGDSKEGSTLHFYIHKNRSFKLPSAEKDIIMIGPGTGIAPFRSFVAERDATGATGRNWLFFGDRNFTTDFSYQTEWQQYLSTGALTKLNLAWSRDTEQKHYVQHELMHESEQLMNWMDKGAYLYVCGNKENMSVDVEKTLIQIIAEYKKLSAEEAGKILKQWSEEGRYEKDVY